MVRLLVAVALVSTFFAGYVIGRLQPQAGPDPTTQSRLEQQVATLQARLRAREDLAASRGAAGTASTMPSAAGTIGCRSHP